MRFTKMQGLGNDYLYVYGEPKDPQALSKRLSDRHFGAGADGMIWISPSDTADFRMRIFNADGSEAEMCGNGIRCVGKYVYDKGLTAKTHLRIETKAGMREVWLYVDGGRATGATVGMGKAVVSEKKMLTIDGTQQVACAPVSMGNPHAVVFVPDAEAAPLYTLGPILSHNEAFPSGTNVEFVEILSPSAIRVRVWERGSGVTLACGTGACASAAAAIAEGLCDNDARIEARLDGGSLWIRQTESGEIFMEGPAETVYEGEIE